jgi:hypothetical protein
MNAKTRGKMWQNSPPPQESTSPPARSIASQRGSADRTKSSAVVASTSSTARTFATTTRRESAGRSASESRSTVKRYARPAASVLICRESGGLVCERGSARRRYRPGSSGQVRRTGGYPRDEPADRPIPARPRWIRWTWISGCSTCCRRPCWTGAPGASIRSP